MNDVNLGYKLIALAVVLGAAYSCSSTGNSQNEGGSTTAALNALRASVDALSAELGELRAEVASIETADTGCSTQDFLAGSCAAQELPDGVAVTATFCFSQGIGIDLSAKYGVEMAVEAEGGAGWPNVAWGKATGKLSFPTGLPSEVAGEAAAGLARGVDICADLPFEPNEEQRMALGELVRGVNIEDGLQARYSRRTNRLLRYAAQRTPYAWGPQNASVGARSVEEADNAFDIADETMDRFFADGLQPQNAAADMMGDPVFRDLAASLDLPGPVAAIIADPQQVLASLVQTNPSTACATFGVDAGARARFGAVNTLCNSIEALPNDQMLKGVGTRLSTVQNSVAAIYTRSQLREFICNNVALAAFNRDC